MFIQNVTEKQFPFKHYIFKDVFSDSELKNIYNFFKNGTLHLNNPNTSGKRISNDFRFFATREHEKKPFIKDIIKNLTEYFQQLFKNEKDLYLRVEFIRDNSNFWLEPHVDIPEKKLSMMIYINPDNIEIPGTLLYTEDLNTTVEVPFLDNTGFYFFPSSNTWHGVSRVKKGPRFAIMANVCTFETDFKLNP